MTVSRSWFPGSGPLLCCRTPDCSSKLHSSLHSGSVVLSRTQVEYFSLPSWMTAYTSLVPCFPFPRSPRPLSTVTWTWVGSHFCVSSWAVNNDMSPANPQRQTQTESEARQSDRGGAYVRLFLRTHIFCSVLSVSYQVSLRPGSVSRVLVSLRLQQGLYPRLFLPTHGFSAGTTSRVCRPPPSCCAVSTLTVTSSAVLLLSPCRPPSLFSPCSSYFSNFTVNT